MMDYKQTVAIVAQFYGECVKCHLNYGNDINNAHKLAYMDIKNMKYNPYSPNGEKLNIQGVEDVKKATMIIQNTIISQNAQKS